MNILDFPKRKQQQSKLSMVTCYDYTSALIVADSDIDLILVGDSTAMVMHGHNTTIPASIEMMAWHTQAVTRGAPDKFIVADLPFLSYRKGLEYTMNCVEKLMHAGAHAVKLEGITGHEDILQHIVQSGVPVMGHLGLTPQSVHQLGGFKVQGKNDNAQQQLIHDAKVLEKLGCFSLVLECIPSELAATITQSTDIVTIGIGAGQDTDGQVLVWQDMLGLGQWNPKFAKKYCHGREIFVKALNEYHQEVQHHDFPVST